MKQIIVSEWKDRFKWIGRTFEDIERNVTYFNWSCSGVEFEFTGNYLIGEFVAISATEFDGLPPKAPTRVIWPWIAVFLDDSQEPYKRIEINHEKEEILLFASEQTETHKIRIIKLTENAKGKVGIRSLLAEGTINDLPEESKDKLQIEFIGDSITCGFGNETTDRDRFFYSAEENGWVSHVAVAARMLQADYSIISVSGITLGKGIGVMKWSLTPMMQIYPYTDYLLEEVLGKKEGYIRWNFTARTPDVIVLNLGTNDSNLIAFEGDTEKGERNFENNYFGFLKSLRELNGADALIICALGSMDYYLYSNIEKAVMKYSAITKDYNVKCFRYGKIVFQEGFGACSHPSAITQLRMGKELAEYLSRMLTDKRSVMRGFIKN